MTERAPPSRIAISNGIRITSRSVRGPIETGAWLRAAMRRAVAREVLQASRRARSTRARARTPCPSSRPDTGPRRTSPRRGPSGSRARRQAPVTGPGARRSRACSRRSRRVIRSTPSGSNVAARPSGVGKTVAPKVVKPVRHSSCAIAGSLSRVRAIRSRLQLGQPARAVDRIDRARAERAGDVAHARARSPPRTTRAPRTPPASARRCPSRAPPRPTRCRAARASRRASSRPATPPRARPAGASCPSTASWLGSYSGGDECGS